MKPVRVAVAALSFSLAGFAGLALHEWYTDTAIIPVKGDRPTIGLGSTFREDGSPVEMGDTITPPQAIARSAAHIAKDEIGLKRCVTGELSQKEYDILVDFAYQYGVPTACSSSIVAHINAGEYESACRAYALYRKIPTGRVGPDGKPILFDCSTPGNRVCPGVWTRSMKRVSDCLAAQ